MTGPRVLVLHASEAGSTTQIAEAVAETLRARGLDADLRPVSESGDLAPYGAVVLGSAVYAGRWRPDAVDFLRRRAAELAARRVWLFQSGPLDRSPGATDMAPPKNIAALAERIGTRGVVTFGGRLAEDAKGFVAHAMVRRGAAGDFRDFDAIRAWANGVARELSSDLSA
jgi:menaquinone-dependent protoporphyrinogen oxidase